MGMQMNSQRYISIILAEQIIELLDNSGATEIEKIVAVEVAQKIVYVSRGSLSTSLPPESAETEKS
jgi:hypothetical protein